MDVSPGRGDMSSSSCWLSETSTRVTTSCHAEGIVALAFALAYTLYHDSKSSSAGFPLGFPVRMCFMQSSTLAIDCFRYRGASGDEPHFEDGLLGRATNCFILLVFVLVVPARDLSGGDWWRAWPPRWELGLMHVLSYCMRTLWEVAEVAMIRRD
jgi:hypothetical protein